MRNIKYRRWDSGFNPDDVGYFTFPLAYEANSSTFTFYAGDVVEQYTGMKDKNGVDIYEGDIILIENTSFVEEIGGHSRYECDNLIASVVFKEEYGAWGVSIDDSLLLEYVAGTESVIEVIGNIHVDKELML